MLRSRIVVVRDPATKWSNTPPSGAISTGKRIGTTMRWRNVTRPEIETGPSCRRQFVQLDGITRMDTDSSRYSSIFMCDDSESGDHHAGRRHARTSCLWSAGDDPGRRQRLQGALASPHPRPAKPAAKLMPGNQNVRRVGDQRPRCCSCSSSSSGSADHLIASSTDLGALAAKQCAQLGAASGCHRDPEAGQWRRVCLGPYDRGLGSVRFRSRYQAIAAGLPIADTHLVASGVALDVGQARSPARAAGALLGP